jgi:hypothetical protein
VCLQVRCQFGRQPIFSLDEESQKNWAWCVRVDGTEGGGDGEGRKSVPMIPFDERHEPELDLEVEEIPERVQGASAGDGQ